MELLLSEVTDDRITITGVSDLPKALKEIVGTGEVKQAAHVTPDKIDELDKAITAGLMGGELHLDYVKLAYPIVIERAEGVVKMASDAGVTVYAPAYSQLVELLYQMKSTDLIKQANGLNNWMDATKGDLFDAIEAGKMDSNGMFNVSVPVKLEFRDEKTKQAFLELSKTRRQTRRQRKAAGQKKAAALVGAIKRVYLDKVKEMAAKLHK